VTEVVNATINDATWLGEQLAEFAKASGNKLFLPVDSVESAETITEVLSLYVVFIARDKDNHSDRKGFLIAQLAQHPLKRSVRWLAEVAWWVVPKHRGGTAAGRLLSAFEDYGREHADLVSVALEKGSPIRDGQLEKRGFREMERSFLMEVSH